MADKLLIATLVGSRELERRLRKMNPKQNRRIVSRALLESMQLTLRISARDKIFPGGTGAPRPDILTSRTGTLRRSLTGNFAINQNEQLQWIEGGTHLVYGAVHEATKRAFLKPALADARTSFDDIFVRWWRRAGELA